MKFLSLSLIRSFTWRWLAHPYDERSSVTRWLYYDQSLAIYSNDNLPSSIKMPKFGAKVCQILNKSSKKCRRTFKILPNLVTLIRSPIQSCVHTNWSREGHDLWSCEGRVGDALCRNSRQVKKMKNFGSRRDDRYRTIGCSVFQLRNNYNFDTKRSSFWGVQI